MEEFLDKPIDNHSKMGDDFINNEGAQLMLELLKWARIFAALLILSSISTVSGSLKYLYANDVSMGMLFSPSLIPSLLHLLIKMLTIIPLIYIFIFSTKCSKAINNEDSTLAFQALKSFNFYFKLSIIIACMEVVLTLFQVLLSDLLK
jgi:hypothetical protein